MSSPTVRGAHIECRGSAVRIPEPNRLTKPLIPVVEFKYLQADDNQTRTSLDADIRVINICDHVTCTEAHIESL